MTRRAPLLLATALTTLATAAGSAAAASPWSAPAALPGVAPQAIAATMTFGGTGIAIAPSPGRPAPAAASRLLRLNADGTVRSTSGLDLAAAFVAPYANDHFVLAGRTIGRTGTIDDSSVVRVGAGAGSGTSVSLRTLPGTQGQRIGGLAANLAGDAAVVTVGLRERQVFLRRARGSAFTRVLAFRVGDKARDATVAVGPDGDVLLVWEDAHHIYARHRGKRSWGAVHRIGDGVQSNLQAAVDGFDHLLVAWKSQRVNEGDAASPAVVWFATAAPRHGFGAAQQVETVGAQGTGRYVSAPGVRLLVTSSSTALLTWTGFDGSHFVVRAQDVSTGRRGATATLSPTGQDAVLGDAAAGDPRGPQLVLWRSGVAGADPATGTAPRVMASVRPSFTARFGAPEPVSEAGVPIPVAPTALVDPMTGRAVAIFARLTPGEAEISARSPIA